jgi:hypothetical protein
MRKIELTIASDYVPSWSIADAIRELFQNALDQEAQCSDNKASWEYDAATQTLSISNKKSVLTTKSLLLGSTTKFGDPATIGQFGEGYKVATLVLLRNNKPVVFYNYGCREVWRPRFVKSRRFGADVLTFFIDTKYPWSSVPDEDLTIKIHNISEDEWNNIIVPTNLHLRTDYTVINDTEFGQILDIPGKVFVNGLFVCDYAEYKYSYNFKPGVLRLDRDRKLVSDFDLKWIASKMWRVAKGPDVALQVAKLLEAGAADVQFIVDIYIGSLQHIAREAYLQFIEAYGSNAVPVCTQYEASKVPNTHKPIIVNATYKHVITSSSLYRAPEPIPEPPSISERLTDWLRKYEEELSVEAASELEELIEAIKEEGH